MYKSFLSWEMAIEKMALFIISDDGWKCTSSINYELKDVWFPTTVKLKPEDFEAVVENEGKSFMVKFKNEQIKIEELK